jgi:oligopeptide/dipeptide ABC transporter ATP-binding protein
VDPAQRRTRIILQGELPSPIARPSGCGFRTRCPLAFERCAAEVPVLEGGGEGQQTEAACWASS